MNTERIKIFTQEMQEESMKIWSETQILSNELETPTKGEISDTISCCLDTIKQASYQIDNALEIIENSMPF